MKFFAKNGLERKNSVKFQSVLSVYPVCIQCVVSGELVVNHSRGFLAYLLPDCFPSLL